MEFSRISINHTIIGCTINPSYNGSIEIIVAYMVRKRYSYVGWKNEIRLEEQGNDYQHHHHQLAAST